MKSNNKIVKKKKHSKTKLACQIVLKAKEKICRNRKKVKKKIIS